MAVAHGERLLAGNAGAAMVCADLRDVPIVLASRQVRDRIDFSRPVGVLMVAVLQYLTDRDDPAGTVARYRDAAPGGSYLVVSHPAAGKPAGAGHTAECTDGTGGHVARFTSRTGNEIAALFTGWDPG